MLQSDESNLGYSWRKLVRAWVAFEIKEAYGCDIAGKLKARNRPTFLKDWIQRAHSTTWRPPTSDMTTIEEDFRKWWTSLQPGWHVHDNGQLDMTRIDGDWSLLRQPGINSFLTILAGLFFWGLAVCGDSVASEEWLHFIDDCIAAFNGLQAAS